MLVPGDEQREAVSALLEIGAGLAGFGLYADALQFASHVKLHARLANLHRELDFLYAEREKDKHILGLLVL